MFSGYLQSRNRNNKCSSERHDRRKIHKNGRENELHDFGNGESSAGKRSSQAKDVGATMPSRAKRNNAESQNTVGLGLGDEEKWKMYQNLHHLVDKYKEMVKKIGTPSSLNTLLSGTDLPYSTEIMAVPLPSKFKVPQIKLYNGSRDPVKHLKTLKAHMTLYEFSGEIACQAFPLTSRRMARGWFGALQLGLIETFEELARLFLMQLMAVGKGGGQRHTS